MITPRQVREVLKDYVHLKHFLDAWFPSGASTARITRCTGAGKPVERFVLAKADVQAVMDVLAFAISRLGERDRQIVTMHYFKRMGAEETARRLGISRRTLFTRLAVIAAEIAAVLNAMDMRVWQAFRRFAQVVLNDVGEIPD